MKKIIALCLVFCLALGLVACGSSSGAAGTTGAAGEGTTAGNGGVFMAGFGMENITPKNSVPMASYGDSRDRMSTGIYTYLEARAVAVQDANGGLLIFAVGDLSWCPKVLGSNIRTKMSKELGIDPAYIILSGTHTHSSVDTGLTDIPAVAEFNNQYIDGMCKAIREAVADLKPAEVYVGSVMTENMNQVRRYIMDDGSLDGDNAYGTGTKRVEHETQADGELQVLKFVREGGKDIVITNFQAHPHLEGKTKNLSSQTVGAIRDEVAAKFDALTLHWQGAAGNLNTAGSLEGEKPYESSPAGVNAYGKAMANYVGTIYDSMNKVETGFVQVREVVYTGKVNHSYDNVVTEAKAVQDYFNNGHTAGETATFAHQLSAEKGLERRINSYFHANRIVGNANLGQTQDMTLYAWSFGDIGGVVLPYELFDTSGMQVKTQSPFARTFIVGYSYPSYVGYIPTAEGFANGGYEADNSTFAAGTAEGMVENYLNMLRDMHK